MVQPAALQTPRRTRRILVRVARVAIVAFATTLSSFGVAEAAVDAKAKPAAA